MDTQKSSHHKQQLNNHYLNIENYELPAPVQTQVTNNRTTNQNLALASTQRRKHHQPRRLPEPLETPLQRPQRH